jgi:hypothetical protein
MGILDWIFRPPGKEKFAAMMIKLLRSGGEERPIEYDPEEFLLRVGKESRVYLGNLYGDYLATPRRQRGAILAKLSRLTQDADANLGYEVAKAKLLPRVRERFYHESVRLNALLNHPQGKFKPMPTRLLNEHLTLEVVIDMPDRVVVVSAEQLKEWG